MWKENSESLLEASNGIVQVQVSKKFGPRILSFSFCNKENILGQAYDTTIETKLGPWKPYAGHRLWVAPESMPGSYVPDNNEIEYEIIDKYTLRLIPSREDYSQLQKELIITLEKDKAALKIKHKITNYGSAKAKLAAWGITIMNPGGEAILPQEPFASWEENFLPVRTIALWQYTKLQDERINLGNKYICIHSQKELAQPQKIGILNKQGWSGYHKEGTLFIKSVPFQKKATYPDLNCNNEVYTAGDFIELETLSPLTTVSSYESVEHTEYWQLFEGVDNYNNEEELDLLINKYSRFKQLPANN